MAVREIVKYPDPRLRQPTTTVVEVTPEIRKLVADMGDTMFAANGAGIAAIQVGSFEKIYIVDAAIGGGREEDPPIVFINPEITWLSEEAELTDEGCLSFPTIFVPVKRSLKAKVKAMNLDGKIFEVEAEGLFARALQHEGDHLTAKLLIDYVGPLKRELIKRKLKREAERERDDEEEDRAAR